MGGVPRSGLVLRKIIFKPSVWKMNWIILFLNGIRLKFELGWAGVLFFWGWGMPTNAQNTSIRQHRREADVGRLVMFDPKKKKDWLYQLEVN